MKNLEMNYVDAIVEAVVEDFNERFQMQEEKIDYLQDIIEEQSFNLRNLRNEG